MALNTFPDASIPVDWGQPKTTTPKVTEAQFGDGYSQRAADGINTLRAVYNVAATAITLVDATTMSDFLDARLGVEAFLWTPPNESEQVFTSPTWRVTPTGAGFANFSARFIKQFDLNI